MALQIAAQAATDVGRKRRHNEDSFLVDEDLQLFVVADGMGGHAAGDVASSYAIEVCQDYLTREKRSIHALATDASYEVRARAQQTIERAIQAACAAVHELGERELAKRGMGTTFVCVAIAGERGVIGHVGDSRIYLLRHGTVHRLTEDHTIVNAQVKAGKITPEQAASSPFANVLTRAVGKQSSVQVDTLSFDLFPGDVYLLCSDGLHGYFTDDEIGSYLGTEPATTTAQRLVDAANERGGKDNITALVLQIKGDTGNRQSTDAAAGLEVLQKIPLFRHLDYKEQTLILSISTTKTFPAGAEIVREGGLPDSLYVIVRGHVEILKGKRPISELRSGGHFGEMGFVEEAPRSATVRAREETTTLVLARYDVVDVMRRDPVLAVKLLWAFVGVLSQRLRHADEEIADLRGDFDEGLARALIPFLRSS